MKTEKYFITAWILEIILMKVAEHFRGYMAFGGENLIYILIVIYIYMKERKNND